MKYIHAVLLLHKTGKPINEKNLIKVLSSVGIEPDLSRIKVLVKILSSVEIEKALKSKEIIIPKNENNRPKPKQIKEKKEQKEEYEGLGNLFN